MGGASCACLAEDDGAEVSVTSSKLYYHEELLEENRKPELAADDKKASDAGGHAGRDKVTVESPRKRPRTPRPVSKTLKRIREGTVFVVRLERGNSKFGVECKEVERLALKVVGIANDGMLALWNVKHPEAEIQLGDYIISANGISGSTALMLQRLLLDDKVELRVQRATEEVK